MYISLHNQTHYSILDALSSPEELINKAVDLGMTSIAITDHGSFAAIWESYKIARKKKIKLLVGCEYFFKRDPKQTHFNHIILLAKNAEGYKNMLSMNFEAFANSPVHSKKMFPVVTWELLEKYSAGTICLTACGSGILAESIMEGKLPEAEADLIRLIDIFGKDNLGVEIQANNLKRFASAYSKEIDQNLINRQLIKLADKHELRIVPSCNSHYTEKEDNSVHDFQLSIGSGQSVFSKFRLRYDLPEFYLKSEEDIKKFFKRNFGEEFATKIIANTTYFADLCEEPVWIDPKFTNPSGKEMPNFPVQDQKDLPEFYEWLHAHPRLDKLPEDAQYLRFRVDKGLRGKNLQDNQVYHDRLEEEFEVIEMKDFSSYMLVVMDFIEFALSQNIAVGPGRGCLKGDTKVLTAEGFKYLKDIVLGDKVFSHTGKLQPIMATFKFDVKDEKVLRLKSNNGFDDLVMTKDHKVYSHICKETKKYKERNQAGSKILSKYRRYESPSIPTWNQAKDLKVGDLIYTTFPEREIFKHDLPKAFKLEASSTKNSKLDKELEIKVDENFFYFLGRFTGDGWLRGSEDQTQNGSYGLGLAFNSNDKEGIERLTKYFEQIGFVVNPYKAKDKNLTQIIIYNKSFMLLIKSFFPDYKSTSKTKHLPTFFRNLNDDELRSLLNGLIDSDGSKKELAENKKLTNRWSIDSTSLRLILEVKEALTYLKVGSSIKTRKEFMREDYLCNKSYKIRFKKSDFVSSTKTGFYSRINEISEEELDHVYDITVDQDHSYLTTNGVVHNSVGGCLIAYLIGIHQSDPIEYDLIFARFLNKEKQGFPDIDQDISARGRDTVKNYLSNKYGKENTAQVSNIGTITPKVYARDVARSFEFGGSRDSAVGLANAIADSIDKDDKTLEDVSSGLFQEFCQKYPDIWLNKKLVGKPRSWGTHAAGLVLGKRPLKGLVPLRLDKDGAVCLELTKDAAEEVGLVKMDLLGLKTLDIMDLTYELIKKNGKTINFPIPLDDKLAYELIASGDNGCVFQLGGSGGTNDLCKKMKSNSIEDISAINALARPALKEYRDPYIKTKHGEKKVNLLHPSLQRSFGKSYGFGLYEESLFYLAQDVAGWDLNKADRLRKMTKDKGKYPEKVAALKEEFINDSVTNGIDRVLGTKIWEEVIDPFGGYGFNKSLSGLVDMDTYSSEGAFLGTKPLEKIISGEYLRSRDESTQEEIFVEVVAKHDHGVLDLVEVELITGEKIRCTMDHKFRTQENGEMLPLHQIIKEQLTIVVDSVECVKD